MKPENQKSFNSPRHALDYLKGRGIFIKQWQDIFRYNHLRFGKVSTHLDVKAINECGSPATYLHGWGENGDRNEYILSPAAYFIASKSNPAILRDISGPYEFNRII